MSGWLFARVISPAGRPRRIALVIEQALARTGTVMVDVVWHTPDDAAVATEQSPAASLTFTASGAWWLKSSAGAGQVDPGCSRCAPAASMNAAIRMALRTGRCRSPSCVSWSR